MKKLSLLLVMMLLVISLTACGCSNSEDSALIAATIATPIATTAATVPATTAAPTTAASAAPTAPTSATQSTDAIQPTDSTQPADATSPTTAEEDDGESILGWVSSVDGNTFSVTVAEGNVYLFEKGTDFVISGGDLDLNNSVSVSYTGDIDGDEIGIAHSVVVTALAE